MDKPGEVVRPHPVCVCVCVCVCVHARAHLGSLRYALIPSAAAVQAVITTFNWLEY